ncbi:MAG TPA: DNA alkylation repair protein [Bacillales bacterium]|nr:DNA alkylation repair protein [Bacillales bacterium]
MQGPYLCPSCGSNRALYNHIQQVAVSMKLDPETGETIEEYENRSDMLPYHFPYQGPEFLIQCGVCGLIAEEQRFLKNARRHPRSQKSL